ncbi:MAG TPA: caspase family protein [Micromonosporaceae bacterium]|nr:caspase family protein [Micromonosporaceae bacterium]
MAGLRKALIVANDEYEHEGLRHLLAPAADAEALARVLGDPQIGDFAVHVMRNEPAHVIQAQIEDLFSESRAEDLLLLHFSCHGLKSESGELFFAACNTRPNRLASSAISADFVQRCMRVSRSRRIVLLLDCCYGGAFSQGVTVRATADVNVLDSFPGGGLGGGRGRAVITASSAMEYAFEGDQLADDHSPRPSVFTSALVEGLATGDADRDQDGWVSLNELYDYVFDRVRAQNPNQTPSRDVEMQGELYLARRSCPVVTPSPLPPELQEVIDHPLAHIRSGAVRELARLQRGRHAGLALAATLALERLANDDSRAVAAAAAAALVAVDQDQGTSSDAPTPVGAEPTPAVAGQAPPADQSAGTRPTEAVSQVPQAARPNADSEEIFAADSLSGLRAARRQRPPTRRWGTQALLQRRRLVYASGAVAVLVVAAMAVLLIADSDTARKGGVRGQGEFTATSPWRLVIRDNISGMDNGCDVTVARTDGGGQKRILDDIYGAKSFQVHESGDFRWEASDPGCLVTQRPGPGKAVLPFAQDSGGDTDAFEVGGPIAVQVVDFNGNSECKFVLHDATDGRQLDFGSVRQGDGPHLLDPGGRPQVYVANLYCGVRISAG